MVAVGRAGFDDRAVGGVESKPSRLSQALTDKAYSQTSQ